MLWKVNGKRYGKKIKTRYIYLHYTCLAKHWRQHIKTENYFLRRFRTFHVQPDLVQCYLNKSISYIIFCSMLLAFYAKY